MRECLCAAKLTTNPRENLKAVPYRGKCAKSSPCRRFSAAVNPPPETSCTETETATDGVYRAQGSLMKWIKVNAIS